MRHVVSEPTPPFEVCDGALRVHQVPALEDNLIWVLECRATGEVAVIDGPRAEEIDAYLNAQNIRATCVFNTHTHWDHVGLNKAWMATGALANMTVVGAVERADDIPGLTHPVDEGDCVAVGNVSGDVWRTEGHLDGHLSFVFDGAVFCGDTLFAGGCGRVESGRPERLHTSLMRLASLPGETAVCCAHEYTLDNLRFAMSVEPDNLALQQRWASVAERRAAGACAVPSTIEEERATNPFLRPGSPQIQECVRRAMPDADLTTPEAVFVAIRALKSRGDYRVAQTES